MVTAIAVIRLLAASQVLFTTLALAVSRNSIQTRALAVALALGIIAYLVLPLMVGHFGPDGFLVLRMAADIVPALLLLFVWVAFEDSDPPPWAWAASLAYLGLLVAERITELMLPASAPVVAVSTQFAKLALAAGALLIVWRGRQIDLVEIRLRLRLAFAAVMGMAVVGIVATELVTGWNVPQTIELIGMTAILLVSLVINLAFLRLNPAFEFGGRPQVRDPAAVADPLIQALTDSMVKQRMYADPDLRIGMLASHLNVAEHRLRRAINKTLGHRNFNQFVNDYRIAEAAERLRTQPHLPVLTIALDTGFRSLSVFNDAFRNRKGCAPTAWRSHSQPDS